MIAHASAQPSAACNRNAYPAGVCSVLFPKAARRFYQKQKSPNITSFKIKEIDGLDAVITFVTPRPLEDVRPLFKHEVLN